MEQVEHKINRLLFAVTIYAPIDGFYEFGGKRMFLKAGEEHIFTFREHEVAGKMLNIEPQMKEVRGQ